MMGNDKSKASLFLKISILNKFFSQFIKKRKKKVLVFASSQQLTPWLVRNVPHVENVHSRLLLFIYGHYL